MHKNAYSWLPSPILILTWAISESVCCRGEGLGLDMNIVWVFWNRPRPMSVISLLVKYKLQEIYLKLS